MAPEVASSKGDKWIERDDRQSPGQVRGLVKLFLGGGFVFLGLSLVYSCIALLDRKTRDTWSEMAQQMGLFGVVLFAFCSVAFERYRRKLLEDRVRTLEAQLSKTQGVAYRHVE
jgi:hypothetical protein